MSHEQSGSVGSPSDVASASTFDHVALHRGLGVSSIVAMVVAGAAPLAVVSLTVPIVITLGGSIAAPLLFVIAGVLLVLFSVGFTSMARHVRNSGAFYSYIQAGLGRFAGLGAATLALVSYFLLQVGLYAYVGISLTGAIDRFFSIDTPWWIWALVAFAIVSLLGYRDIELSSKVLIVALVAETSAVLILDGAIFLTGGADGWSAEPFDPSQLSHGAPSLGLMFALFSFIGFEATAVFRNEARDPDTTIPRATYVAVVSVAALYAISAFAVVLGAGADKALEVATTDPAVMTPNLYLEYTGSVINDLTTALLVSSTFACVLTFHNVLTRYQYTLGSLKVLPTKLATVHPQHRAPSFSSLVVTVISGAMLVAMMVTGLDPVLEIYTWFSGAAILGLLTLMALTSVAVIAFFRSHSGEKNVLSTVIAPVLATVGLVAVVVIGLMNIELLIPSSGATASLLTILVASFVVGIFVAARMKRTNPVAFEHLHDQES
jgi:amino acid transporter